MLVFGSLLLAPLCAAAQSETRAAVAEALYRQARDLMAAGKYDEACPKFAESQRLDPATGTLLNLAACHERQGKLATAWVEYSDAMVASRRDNRPDRVEYAQARVLELEPKLSRLTVVLAPDADVLDLELELDGSRIGRAALGVSTPVDPGKHTVQAKAPGKQPWLGVVELGAQADQQTITIPRLVDAPLAAPAASPAASAPQPAAAPAPKPVVAARDELDERPVPGRVYVAGGATLLLAVGAGVTGVLYLDKRASFRESQPEGAPMTADSEERWDSARVYGVVNAGLWAATVGGAALTTYLYVTRPRRTEETPRLTAWAAPGAGGLGLVGGF